MPMILFSSVNPDTIKDALQKFKIEVYDVFITYPILVPNLIILQIYFTRLDGLIWQLGDDLIYVY